MISFLLFSLFGLLEANICPPNEDMTPCECFTAYEDIFVSCKDILTPEELIPPMRAIAKSETKVLALTIEKSSLLYLPDNLFKNAHVEMVHFDSTEIMSLSESGTAFNGLEEIITEVRAMDAKFVSHWDFSELRNLKKLNLIDVHHMILGAIDHPFPNLPELQALGIISAEITYITDDAFANLTKLTIVNLKDNEISELKRSMFPDPANSLSYIDLSQNMLSTLPPDFFENMPSLTNVHLSKNKFVTLSEKPFSDALNNLQQLWMSGNPFRCDCRMNWLVEIRFPQHFQGDCLSPEALAGRSIKSLDLKSLWC